MINKTSKLNTRILTYSIVGLVLLFFSVMPATALIIGIPGNQPVKDGGFYPGTWPPGAVKLANLPNRIGGWEGPPYGGGEYTFLYRCQKTEQFNEALKIFAAILAPKLELVIHDGPKYDPIDKTRMDWLFTVWNSEKWNEAYKRAVKIPELSKGLSPSHPRIDVYIGGGNIIWEEVKVPENISVTDQRSKSAVKQTGAAEQKNKQYQAALSCANQVVTFLKKNDMVGLARFVHPQKGVRFSPYCYVDTDNDLVFSKEQLAGFYSDKQEYTWGRYDGSGNLIVMTWPQYMKRFVFNRDYSKADTVSVNHDRSSGNTKNNAASVYPNALRIEYYFEQSDDPKASIDWCALRLILEEYNGNWYIIGIIHDQWTI